MGPGFRCCIRERHGKKGLGSPRGKRFWSLGTRGEGSPRKQGGCSLTQLSKHLAQPVERPPTISGALRVGAGVWREVSTRSNG